MRNANSLGYLNSAQALADYAAVIMHVKNKLSAQNSPVIVIGGSYGGSMLPELVTPIQFMEIIFLFIFH